jgi:Domain of unknown function (DUF4145)
MNVNPDLYEPHQQRNSVNLFVPPILSRKGKGTILAQWLGQSGLIQFDCICIEQLTAGAIMQSDIVVRCPKCERDRHLKPHGEYFHRDDESEPIVRYTFGGCATCGTPFVVEQTDYGGGFDGEESSIVYPEDDGSVKATLPPVVRASYDAARGCQVAKQWMPAAVMVGRTLEAVCHDQGSQKTMAADLKDLRDQGKISEELWQSSEQLRFLRNIGAHPSSDPITREDAEDSMNLLQAILETLYHLRPKFEAMKARRAKK